MVQRISALAPKQPGILERAWAMFVSLFVGAEPIEVIDQRFNFLPHCFRWRGDLRRVRMVSRVWEQPQSGLQPPRRYYEVICGQGKRYVLFQDVRIGTWHMSL
jgi:hypothetical protein